KQQLPPGVLAHSPRGDSWAPRHTISAVTSRSHHLLLGIWSIFAVQTQNSLDLTPVNRSN
ncbi:unnamed protein product, partial [Ceratitis capitata]